MRRAVIIGAGPAGLTAAYQLLKETDVMPVIYEAETFVGGISRTASYAGGRLDIGPHRFFSKSPEVNAIWSELMPTQGAPSKDDRLTGAGHNKYLAPGGPDPDKADALWLIRDRITRILFDGKLFDYPVSLKAQTLINMGVARTIRAGVGYVAARLRKREERSLEDFYINRFGKPLYSLFFEDYTEKLWGVHPSQISAEWGAQRVKELSVWKILVEGAAKLVRKSHKTNTTSLIERFIYPKNGAGELYGVMADRIAEMGGVIKLGARVKALRVSEGRVVGAEIDGPDGYAPGDLFFSTMPVKDLVSALGTGGAAIPNDARRVAEALPYRDLVVVGLTLKKLKLRNTTRVKTVGDIIPDCWIYLQERGLRAGRMQITNNMSPYLVNDFGRSVGIGLEYFCSEGDAMWNMGDDDIVRYAVGELGGCDPLRGRIVDAEDVLASTVIRVKKAYPAYFGAYAEFDKVRRLLDGFPNLYCVGRNGQHRYNNMDHSMLTAIEAVRLVREAKAGGADRSAAWNVNTEAEYHERA